MSLRSRLLGIVLALVLVPLVAGGLLAAGFVSEAQSARAQDTVRTGAAGVRTLLVDACQRAGIAARSLAADAMLTGPAGATMRLAEADYVSYAAILGPSGEVQAEAGERPDEVPSPQQDCTADPAAPTGSVSERLALPDGRRTALVVTPGDEDFLTTARRSLELVGEDEDVEVVLLRTDGSVAAATLGAPEVETLAAATAGVTEGRGVEVDEWVAWVRPPRPGVPLRVVVAQQRPDVTDFYAAIAAVVLAVGAMGLLLGRDIARRETRPLEELTAAAERVAGGDLDQTLPVRRRDETGRLAAAFNDMTLALRETVTALQRSRDDLRESLHRLGETLGSTHDLPGLLTAVLDSAVVAVSARGGAVYADDGAGRFRLVAAQGPAQSRPDPLRPTDDGLLALAVATREVQQDAERMVVPLLRGARVVGLLVLEPDPAGPALGHDAARALTALAGQAGVAVDNVMLHREAQRLSTTDALTGLPNFRLLSMSLAREIERATRFDRPLAVLMMDIDHFKAVNDTHGHARGDEVLRELAARVAEQVREIDTLARYGGEEFVLVLPETGLDGGARLAERIRTAVRRQRFVSEEPDQPPLRITVSLGLAAFPEHGASAATLMRTADTALYAAKAAGRDRWAVAAG